MEGLAAPVDLLGAPLVAFVLALGAALLRFEVRLPDALPPVLATFLLLAIGLKGGRSLAAGGSVGIARPVAATLVMAVITPLVTYAVVRRAVGLPRVDAAGVAAHYGSASVVTFVVALETIEARGFEVEGLMTGLLAILEVVGIVVGLALARDPDVRWSGAIGGILRGRSITALLLGIAIGVVVGDDRLAATDALFVGLFEGVLVLFLIELGAVAAERLRDVAAVGPRLVIAAVAGPIVIGGSGATLGALAGLSTGGVAVLATLAASASYIAAPAAVRFALPEANPALSITPTLGVTFPFNLVVGIPLYVWMATRLT